MVKEILEKIRKYPVVFFFFFDIFLVSLASLMAFLLRFDGQFPLEKFDNFKFFTFIAIIITPPIFYIFRLYKLSWSYVSITDIPNIVKGVFFSVFLLGTVLYLFKSTQIFSGFPTSVIFLYGMILFILISFLRFLKRIYWQLIRSGPTVLGPKKSADSLSVSKFFNRQEIRCILVTGGAGYIGSVVVRKLLEEGYKVKVIDNLLFGSNSIKDLYQNSNFQFIEADILNTAVLEKVLFDVDTVIHLAAIVGEAACISRKDIAIQTNYLGTTYLARLCKAYGIRRFIYSSTCSAYGNSERAEKVDERVPLRPIDFYGETKLYAERELHKITDEKFLPTILRLATVYGLSPRMRFDLVVNSFAKKAVKEGEIVIFGGDQWRPFIHVSDVARVILLVLKAPFSKTGNQIFNVGDNKENYLFTQLGELIKKQMPSVIVKKIDRINDKRNYLVNFSKIEKVLGFHSQRRVEDGLAEIIKSVKEGRFNNADEKIYYNHLV